MLEPTDEGKELTTGALLDARANDRQFPYHGNFDAWYLVSLIDAWCKYCSVLDIQHYPLAHVVT